MDIKKALVGIRELRDGVRAKNPPPAEGGASEDDNIVYFSLVRGTRPYLERIVHQINGAYENGWYDASAVMIRRLVETLIIEVFENNGLAEKIKDANGDFLYLGDLIARLSAEPSFTLSRSVKKALPELKGVGDKSAHSRHFTAHRKDIEKLVPFLRDVVQELVSQAKLKK